MRNINKDQYRSKPFVKTLFKCIKKLQLTTTIVAGIATGVLHHIYYLL